MMSVLMVLLMLVKIEDERTCTEGVAQSRVEVEKFYVTLWCTCTHPCALYFEDYSGPRRACFISYLCLLIDRIRLDSLNSVDDAGCVELYSFSDSASSSRMQWGQSLKDKMIETVLLFLSKSVSPSNTTQRKVSLKYNDFKIVQL